MINKNIIANMVLTAIIAGVTAAFYVGKLDGRVESLKDNINEFEGDINEFEQYIDNNRRVIDEGVIAVQESIQTFTDTQMQKLGDVDIDPKRYLIIDEAEAFDRHWEQGSLPNSSPPPVRLTKDAHACFLTRVTGLFAGHGEEVKVYKEDDGVWYLYGKSHQKDVAASARCIKLKLARSP